MIPEDLRNEFKALSGDNWINSQGEPDIDYVSWLEKKLIKNHGVSHDVSNSDYILCQCESEDECMGVDCSVIKCKKK